MSYQTKPNISDLPDGRSMIRIRLRNSCRTPAYKMTQKSQALLAPAQYNGPFMYDAFGTPTSKVPIAPGGFFYCDLIFKAEEMNEEHKKLIADKALEIWVFGEVSYYDTFGGQHSTTFRLVRGGRFVTNGTEFKAVPTEMKPIDHIEFFGAFRDFVS